MSEYYIVVDEDKCYLDKPILDCNGDEIGYRRTVVMTKEAFIECYNKWIKGEESEAAAL